jgi:hypothetical protein
MKEEALRLKLLRGITQFAIEPYGAAYRDSSALVTHVPHPLRV